ncbi:MAG: nucleotidyltransferase domain-containing protein [Clostridia bacterium]|nr:nucleotidyltransferase domain-containing protein [Clostridia bacterium]
MMTVNDTLDMRRFPVTVQTKCKNIDRIYPLKQDQVARIFNCASHFPIITRITVFGSSVTPKCHIDSDIDLCIDADTSDGLKVFEMQKAIGDLCDWNCDILMASSIGKALRETIGKEGVIIYEQSA